MKKLARVRLKGTPLQGNVSGVYERAGEALYEVQWDGNQSDTARYRAEELEPGERAERYASALYEEPYDRRAFELDRLKAAQEGHPTRQRT